MVFRELVEHLRALSSVEIIADNAVSEITEVRFIDLRQTDFSSNILYFSNNLSGVTTLPAQCIITDAGSIADLSTADRSIAVVPEVDFGFIFNSAFQLIIDSHKDNYYESMMRTLDLVRNVDALIDIASQSFGASLVFIDRDFRILSYSTQIPVTDELWKHNIEQGYCDYEFIKAVRSLKSVQMADSTMMPIEVSCTSSPFQKFSCRVYCRDIWIGFLIVIEGYDSYRVEHSEMLRVLSAVLGYAVMKYEPSYLYMTSDYHRFLYNLVIGANASALPEAYMNLSFPSKMQVLYCRATGNQTIFPQEGSLTETMTSIIPGCHVIGRRRSAIIIGSHEMLQKVGLVFSAFPAECIIKIGVSLPFTDISTLKAHYDEAHDALELGLMLDPDLSIYTFEDYGIYAMFRTVAEKEDLRRYLHPALPVLSDYDSKNGTQLELTLYTYLKCACSTTDTADALFLHRNSVIYRLHRIEDLCDIDLSDTDTGFRLRLSFAINNVINQKRIWSGKGPANE